MKLSAFAQFAEQEVDNSAIAIDWSPRVGTPQETAYFSLADEMFFGGIAGSGKSDLVLGLAFKEHEKSIIFRRQFPQLAGMIDRSIEIVGSSERYNQSKKVWKLGDRTIEFGSVPHEKDKEKYQGRPHDLIAIDELTHFTESIYTYITGWNRTTTPGQRCRIVATGNPPTTQEGRWVIKYFAPWLDPKYPARTGRPKAEGGELRWFVRHPKTGESMEVDSGDEIEIAGEIVEPKSRTFIPGKLLDELIATGYRATLQGLPEPLRSILLKGDFNTQVEADPWQVIPTAWVQAAVDRWNKISPGKQTHLGVDPSRGGKDETVICSRHGNWIAPLIAYPGSQIPDGEVVADLVQQNVQEPGVTIRLDSLGVGSSPYDFLKRRKANIIGMQSGAGSVDAYGKPKTDRTGQMVFANRRAEWWWNLRERFDPKHPNCIAIPDDEKLFEDLTTPRWSITSRRGELGEILIESKQDLATSDRLGRSPDRGDALAYAMAEVVESNSDWLNYL